MSSDPQWKAFQSSVMDSDTAILDCKGLASVMPSHGASNGTSYNSGNHYSYHHKENNMYTNTNRLHDSSYYNYNTWGGGGGGGSGGGNGGGNGGNGGGGSGCGSGSNSASATFSIGTFTGREGTEVMNGGDSSPSSTNSYNNHGHSNNADGSFQRETGIIEKLLHSYGFIQCCERQARLFFHFSQFNGNIEHLKIGDPVEFEMTYDRRTGKPIASFVSKIAPEVVLSEERVTGNVTTEIRSDGSGENQGRISYENRGECFFLPYNKEDVEGNVTLRSGDKVSFQIAANQRGNLGASHVRLENAAHPVKYQGVVCTMKESFGFIERADIVKEIFFHFSESNAKRELQLGDDVEFTIQTRNGKEVACGITLLNPGSVIFEDVCDEILRGQVLKPLERGQQARHQNDPLPGRIKYRAADHSEVEVPFGEKDQKGDFTLKHGDWVEFHLATDRRDSLKRATRISLLDDSFVVSGERREQGMVSLVKDCFGFIRCVEREQELFFRFHEILDVDRVESPAPGDEVEFTMVPDSTSSFSQNRQNAIRIKYLPPNTVHFETLIKEKVSGTVTADVVNYNQRSPTKSQANGKVESGQITYVSGDAKKTINYYQKDCDSKNMPKLGDKVEFDIAQVRSNRKFIAMNVHVKQRAPDNEVQHNGKGHRDVPIYQGFIAALKDGFGFIENITHDKEVFFHFSTLDGDATKLALGLEVEYNLGGRGNSGSCMSAENVRLLPRGTIKLPEVQQEILNGKILRPLRSVNPDQDHYAGIVQANSESDEEKGEQYEFGITSLANKKELLQVGDPVTFQVDAEGRAANVAAIRKKRRATVDLVKPQYGFLSYEVEEGKKLFFHTSEVKDNVQLQAGDTVEFVLVTNHRNGKSSACNVTKVSENIQRPERLISRLRTLSVDDSGPKLTVTRQPKGPDSTKGFSPAHRQPRQAGVLLE